MPPLGGKHDSDGEFGSLTHYDYGFRIYNPAIGKFLSVDPLTKSYPMLTPYQFASNRPIDGVDLDGLEWDYYRNTNNDGKSKIEIVVNVNLEYDAMDLKKLGVDINTYKIAISNHFNSVLQNSNNNVTGKVLFEPVKNLKVSIPTININSKFRAFDDIAPGGTTGNYISVKMLSKYNLPYSPEEFASTVTHELLHTLRFEHPFEYTQTADTELVNVGKNKYQTTDNTSSRIFFNIMNYHKISINGFNLGKIYNQTGIESLTLDQVDFMLQEIDLQKQGAGKEGFTDSYYEEMPIGKKVEKN